MMVREGLGFVVMSGQLPKVEVDVVWIAALGFQLNGHVFDAEICRDPVLDQLQQLQRGAMMFDHDVAGEHDQPGLDRPNVQIMDVPHAGDGFHRGCDMGCTDARRTTISELPTIPRHPRPLQLLN